MAPDAPSAGAVWARGIPALAVGLLAMSAWRESPLAFAGASALVAALVASRFMLLKEKPARPWTEPAAGAMLGVGWGLFAAVAVERLPFRFAGEPPVALYAFAFAFGLATHRKHRALRDAGQRAAALALLVVGLGLAGFGGFSLLNALVESRGLNALLGAVYALYGVKQLLGYIGDEQDPTAVPDTPRGAAVAWLKANRTANVILVLLVVAYFALRGTLASAVPYFPLVEFMFGMLLFGLALARLRSRLKRNLAERPVASERRVHAPRIDTLTEADYEEVRRPVEWFVEAGHAQEDYVLAFRRSLGLGDAEASRVLEPVLAYRRPRRESALPLGAALAASLVASSGLALAFATFLRTVARAPMDVAVTAFLVVLGLGVYALQSELFRRARPAAGLGAAVAGVSLSALVFVAFVAAESRGSALQEPAFWTLVLVPVVALLAIAGFSAWRLAKRLRAGEPHDATTDVPEEEVAKGIAGARRRMKLLAVTLGIILVALPLMLGVLADAGLRFFFEGLRDALGLVAPSVTVFLLALVAAAGVRWFALASARERVLREAEARRAERLARHKAVMERVAGLA